MKLKFCLLIIFGFGMMSCMPIAQLIYGVHQPKYLSDADVVKYYDRLGSEDEIYRLKDYNEANLSKYRYTGNGMPGMLVFNSAGQLTKFETDCSKDLDSIAQLSIEDIDHLSLAGKSLPEFFGDTYVIKASNNEDLPYSNKPLYVFNLRNMLGL